MHDDPESAAAAQEPVYEAPERFGGREIAFVSVCVRALVQAATNRRPEGKLLDATPRIGVGLKSAGLDVDGEQKPRRHVAVVFAQPMSLPVQRYTWHVRL